MTNDYEKQRDEAAFKHIDHGATIDCSALELLAFKAGSDWGSDWAREALLSYIPKVPTQSYERRMAKEILKLKRRIKELEDAASAK